MNIENAFDKVTDKISNMTDKIKKSGNVWEKMGRIALIIFFILVALVPFFVYFMFFAKDNTIDVKVDGEISTIENNDDVDYDKLKKANDKVKNFTKKKKNEKKEK